MLEGVGVQTIGGMIAIILTGRLTPLDCYIGLATATGNVELQHPSGSLGCEYDIDNVRLFVEHQSSPASGNDHPGMNHAGVKYLVPIGDVLTAYAGVSVEFGSPLVHMDNPLGIIGVETNGDVRLYAEHINSVSNPNEGYTAAGVKFFF